MCLRPFYLYFGAFVFIFEKIQKKRGCIRGEERTAVPGKDQEPRPDSPEAQLRYVSGTAGSIISDF